MVSLWFSVVEWRLRTSLANTLKTDGALETVVSDSVHTPVASPSRGAAVLHAVCCRQIHCLVICYVE